MMLKSLKTILLAICLTFIIATTYAYGGVPQLINYQGTLTTAAGAPVQDGQYAIVFTIYDVKDNGIPLWTETWNGTTSSVVTSNGNFNAMLGSFNTIPASFFADHPVTYLGIKVGNDSEMLPRQRIVSAGYAFTAGNGVPKKGIIMWSGAISEIPEGWALCDGSNGTPNLKDKFVLGAGGSLSVTGGVASISLAHSHTVNAHSHSYSGATGGPSGTSDAQKGDGTPKPESTHTHSYSGATSGASNRGTDSQLDASQSILPPYYALAYIMKL